MKRFLIGALIAAFASSAMAAPLPLSNGIYDTFNSGLNSIITSYNSTATAAQLVAAGTGTTTSTITGTRIQVSVTGLTTGASTLSAAMTVTDTAVTANSQAICQTTGYAGTGVPVVVNITPTANTLAFNIQNVSTGAALNATVVVNCLIFN